jgi:hypothetical protein
MRDLGLGVKGLPYQEERKGIERQAHGMKAKAVQPALDIFERLDDVAPGEALI